jgi:hypothetical protein
MQVRYSNLGREVEPVGASPGVPSPHHQVHLAAMIKLKNNLDTFSHVVQKDRHQDLPNTCSYHKTHSIPVLTLFVPSRERNKTYYE